VAAVRVSSVAAIAEMTLNSRQRDEFLKALEEAQRAAMAGRAAQEDARKTPRSALGGIHFRQTIDRITGTLRSYISAGLAARLYNEGTERRTRGHAARRSARSEHDEIVAELHLTSNLTPHDLKLIRRRFALANHPDRVALHLREQATRRMTIANSLIDQALREMKSRIR